MGAAVGSGDVSVRVFDARLNGVLIVRYCQVAELRLQVLIHRQVQEGVQWMFSVHLRHLLNGEALIPVVPFVGPPETP